MSCIVQECSAHIGPIGLSSEMEMVAYVGEYHTIHWWLVVAHGSNRSFNLFTPHLKDYFLRVACDRLSVIE